MPRRKRSTLHNKAPLLFTESPVNKQHNPPMPVYCSDHPPTAKSIPVEDYNDLTWVSPQFNAIALTVKGKPRASRRRPYPLGNTIKSCTSTLVDKENVQLNGKQKRSKYKPLKFQGEHSLPNTVIEDVDIASEEESCNHSKNHTQIDRNSPILKRRIRKRKLKSFEISDTVHKESNTERGDLSSPEDFEDVNVSVHTPVDKCQDYLSNEISNKVGEATAVSNQLDSPVKVLFPGSVLGRTLRSDGETISDTFDKSVKCNKRQTKIKDSASVIVKNLGLNTTLIHTPEIGQKGKILVADTPEAEYNVPVRKRKLRNRLVNL